MKAHRCIECEPAVLHLPEELCPTCGRCADHCRAFDLSHMHMSKRPVEEEP
jgi:hypothetical protein